MALPMLVGGAECGPSNPLQGLTKRFDQDRGVQQDLFTGARAGSSREAFRSQQAGPSTADRNDAAQFFNQTNRTPGFQTPDAFHMGALHGALPQSQGTPLQSMTADAGWATDFMQQQSFTPSASTTQLASSTSTIQGREMIQSPPIQQATTPAYSSGGVMPWNGGMPTWATRSMPNFAPQINQPAQQVDRPSSSFDHASWDKEFDAHQLAPTPQHQQPEQLAREKPQDYDELAHTAGLLLDTVREEQNPKFQNSQFMSLMTQLRDRKVVVEGNQFVENTGQTTTTDVKGKGKAVEQPFISNGMSMGSMLGTSSALRGDEQSGVQGQEDENDIYFSQENAEYTRFWNEMNSMKGVSSREKSHTWDTLQDSWERFEASEKGIRPVMHYKFQQNNPYMRGEARTRHHMMHSDERLESVLELEAVVQRDPTNAHSWFELGVKQQENEREQKAMQALQRAVELDPTHLPSWLALAVSYTNDGYRLGTYEAVKEWVMRNNRYKATVQEHLQRFPEPQDASVKEKFDGLVECLLAMVRQNPPAEVDADLQIALGVLFYTEEHYQKAEDCFLAALSVNSNDWLLYNRVGATTANRGEADKAIMYYNHALNLNPGYIRARYNLGISYINLRQYHEAAQHILSALQLQEADNTQGDDDTGNDRGVTSNALWDSLKTVSLHMERHDLATLCDRRDIEGETMLSANLNANSYPSSIPVQPYDHVDHLFFTSKFRLLLGDHIPHVLNIVVGHRDDSGCSANHLMSAAGTGQKRQSKAKRAQRRSRCVVEHKGIKSRKPNKPAQHTNLFFLPRSLASSLTSFNFTHLNTLEYFTMEAVMRVTDAVKSFRETRLSALRPPTEFFDYHRISRPADLNQATQRFALIAYLSFTGNYVLVIAALAIYALISNLVLLIALLFLVGGFTAINKFAPEPVQMGEHTITQKHLYIGLFVIGLPLLWYASPVWTFFWLAGASGVLILGHASLLEPGVESEYAQVQDTV
ncbi:hypothetical protein VNI00_004083 [Paramarasmius palmivorus]|uniref:Peroxin-5 n=1 Tax=Paramarasmius palmivorus TaxID=297713 RepID=A0AAW0DKZ5_9AGAR